MSGADLKMQRDARAPGARPKLSILPRNALVYLARALEYGADKYARGNYFGPAPDGVKPEDRLLGYLDAALRHGTHPAHALNRLKGGNGGTVEDAAGVRDEEASGGFPASMLPHLAHMLASVAIAIECAIDDGLLPADPGQPWAAAQRAHADDIPQKEDPAAEKARVEARYTYRPDVDPEPSDEAKWWVRGTFGEDTTFEPGSKARQFAQQVDRGGERVLGTIRKIKGTP